MNEKLAQGLKEKFDTIDTSGIIDEMIREFDPTEEELEELRRDEKENPQLYKELNEKLSQI